MHYEYFDLNVLITQSYKQVAEYPRYTEVPITMANDTSDFDVMDVINHADLLQDTETTVLARGAIEALQQDWADKCPDVTLWEALETEWSECDTPEAKRRYMRIRRSLSRFREKLSKNDPVTPFI